MSTTLLILIALALIWIASGSPARSGDVTLVRLPDRDAVGQPESDSRSR